MADPIEAEDLTLPDKEPEVSVLELSDEDFAKLPQSPEVINEPVVDVPNTDPVVVDASDPPDPDASEDEPVLDELDPAPVKDEPADPDDKVGDPPAEAGEDPVVAPKAEAVDYKAEYEKLIAPFKANGVDIQVKNSEEILTLMKMGANYHKKMATIKPSLKTVKLLEREGIDEAQLSFLIDLHKKDPAAITKYIKESGVDPLSIDTEAADNYTPQTHKISDVELNLDEVLQSIEGSPTYARTLSVVSETWDNSSRNDIASNPQSIAILNEQIASGVFDQIQSEVTRARQFGKLQGVSDFEAYKQMGNHLDTIGAFKKPAPPVQVNAKIADNAQKKVADDKREKARKAATITTGSTAKVKPVTNILNLSDEEFSKLPPTAYTQI